MTPSAQLKPDDRKRFTWPMYAVSARARFECPVVVVVVTPDSGTARWAALPVDLGAGIMWHPLVVGPDGIPVVTDIAQAIRTPQLAVLSVMAHGKGDPEIAVAIARAAVAGIDLLRDDNRLLYFALVESALSETARKALEMIPDVERFLNESQRGVFAKGKAEGEANAVLRVLTRRGLAISESQRKRIAACTDLSELERWLDRAVTAAATDDLFV